MENLSTESTRQVAVPSNEEPESADLLRVLYGDTAVYDFEIISP